MLLLSTIPFVVWGWSQLATPMFVQRYFIADVFIACFVLAELTRFAMNSVAAIDRSGKLPRTWISVLPKAACTALIVAYLTVPSLTIFLQLKSGQFKSCPITWLGSSCRIIPRIHP